MPPKELVLCPREAEGCHSEEPFDCAQDKLRDEESPSQSLVS
jgi:hypothetical protein